MDNSPSRATAAPATADAIAAPANKTRSGSAMSTPPSLLARMAALFAAKPGLYSKSALVAGAFGVAALTTVGQLELRGAMQSSMTGAALWHSMTFANQLVFVFGFLFGLWTPILLAARAACRITAEQISGRPLSMPRVLFDMVRFVPAALVYSLIIGLPVAVGAAMFFCPGILAASLFALVVPAGVCEPAGLFATLRRGISLAGKVFGKLFLLILTCCAILVLVVALRVYGLDQFLPGSGLAMFATRFAVTYIPAVFVLLLANICFTLLYLEASGASAPVSASPKPSGAIAG
jgi:hypothetical protein